VGNSIVVSGLLLLIVVANLIFERWRTYPLALPYAGIIVSAMLAYFIPFARSSVQKRGRARNGCYITTGMRSLVLITIGLYVGSWIARRK
jgi:hypothetical protein